MNQIDVPYGVTVADLEAINTFANAELSQIVLQQESNTATGLPLTDKERAQRKEQEHKKNEEKNRLRKQPKQLLLEAGLPT